MIINGLKINYKTIGEGKTFLILHGWGSDSSKWQKVGELLSKRGFKVIIPDLPGFGNSQTPNFVFTVEDYSNFVKKFVDLLNIKKFYLLGHSFGGAVALMYSLKFPEEIEKLFLVGAACVRKKSFKVKLLNFLSKFFKLKSLFFRKIFYRKTDYLSVSGIMKEIYLKLIEKDLTDFFDKVSVSTTIIWGKKDKITPLKNAYLMNSKILNSKLEIIPESDHSPHLKTPEKLVEIISKYL